MARWLKTSQAASILAAVWIGLAQVDCSTFDDLALQGCGHAWVEPPSHFDNRFAPQSTFVVVVRKYDFGEGPNGEFIGFDLDGECTRDGLHPSCRPLPGGEPFQSDGPDGRDNVGLFLARKFGNGLLAQSADAAVTHGGPAVVFRIRNYNLLSEDADVSVDVFAAMQEHPDGSPQPWVLLGDWVAQRSAIGESGPAKLDGGMSEGGTGFSGVSSPAAIYTSQTAYVTKDKLVAHFDEVLGVPWLHLTNVWLQADVVLTGPAADHLRLENGVLAGRLNVDEALPLLELSKDGRTSAGCIDDDWYYGTAKPAVCALADIRLLDDDSSAPCNAVSWSFGFGADAVTISSADREIGPATPIRLCRTGIPLSDDHCDAPDPRGPGAAKPP